MRWLMPRLAGFRAEHPDVQVQVATSHEPVDFARDEADVGFHYGKRVPEGVGGELLFREVLLPVCTPGLARDIGLARDLVRAVLLHSVRRPGDWPLWLSAAGVNGTAIPQEIVLENSTFTWQAAVEGLGVAIAQAAFIADGLKAGQVVAPIQLPLETAQAYHFVYPQERAAQRKIRLFRSWILKQAAITRERDLPRSVGGRGE